MAVIEIDHVSKTYRSRGHATRANDDVSLSVGEGEVYGLFGHNGAGKTTLVNQLLGLLKPDSGSIVISGTNIIEEPSRGRYLCSVQPQSKTPLGELTPRSAVRVMGQLRGMDPASVDHSIEELFEKLDIAKWADVMGNKLSGGILRLTGFCMAAVAPGDAIVLDEPTNDVDPVRRRHLWEAIRDVARTGVAVVLVTHNIREAQNIVDDMAILDEGRVIVQGRRTELLREFAGDRIKLELVPRPDVPTLVVPGWAKSVSSENGLMTITLPHSSGPAALQWAGEAQGCGQIRDYSLTEISLEDLYIDKVGKQKDGESQ